MPIPTKLARLLCASGLVLMSAEAKATETFTYNSVGRLKVVTSETGQTRTYRYDRADNLVEITLSGGGASAPPEPDNHTPLMTADQISTPQDTTVNFDPRGNDWDPDGDPLTIVDHSNPSAGSVSIILSGGGLSYTPNAGFNGVDGFSYTVDDGNGGINSTTVSITVGSGSSSENEPPLALDDDVSTPADTAVVLDPRGNDWDPDGDPMTITVFPTTPSNGLAEIILNGGGVRYTPNAGFSGTDTFTYTVEDGQGGSDTATISVTVGSGSGSDNEAPLALNDDVTTEADTAVAFDPRGNDWDPDGDPMTITVFPTTPSNGQAEIILNGGGVRYTPNAGFTGTDTFSYTVEDGQGGNDTASISVTVGGGGSQPTNEPPLALDDNVTTTTNTAVVLDPRGNDWDPDGDPMTITGFPSPANNGLAEVILNGGGVRYTPKPGFTGTDTFIYTVEDGQGGSDSATISVTVNP